MALTAYQNKTALLLQNPAATTSLYATSDLNTWINMARGQIAGDGRCIRYYTQLATVIGQQAYPFSSVVVAATMAGVLNVRMITSTVSGGGYMLAPWPWEYFNQYFIGSTGIAAGRPTDWAQYGQGVSGTIYLNPIPDAINVLHCDVVAYPVDLVNDATVEAIPYPWTDCVPYFAAYLALLSSQTGAREGQANNMFQRYAEFRNRAREYSTPDVVPYQYNQSGTQSPVPPAGVQAARG